MAYYRYMQHADPAPPVARSVGDRLLACGYPATTAGWGENIAYGFSTRERGDAGLAQLVRASRQHRERELPLDRRRRRRVEQRHALLDAGVRHIDRRWRDASSTSTAASSSAAPTYACSNGADDDGDGKVDYPADPGCTSTTDNDEYNAPAPPPPAPSYACSNGKDDDGDGKIDYPADPGCTGTTDNDEYNAPAPPPPAPSYACSNGKDDDGDGKIDYPADPGCTGPTDNTETSGIFG